MNEIQTNKKTINAWCMYDWANSVYNLVINTAIFPIYYNAVTKDLLPDNKVSFFGLEITNSVLYSYAISVSYLISAILLPLLSGIADYTGEKKKYLKIFTTLGSLSCMGMYFFDSNSVEWGIICVVLASVGYSSGLVFYDAYLPEIAPPSMTDRISARGYSFGYIGGALLLIISLVLIQLWEPIGFPSEKDATKTTFLIVGVWWIGFAQIPFRRLPNNIYNKKPSGKILMNGYLELKKVWEQLKTLANLRKYLIAFFFFNMGVQTVMLLSTLFGDKELHMPTDDLIKILLIIQFIAAVGAILFARISDKFGNKISLSVMIFVWIGICVSAYFITTGSQFYIVAVFVGLVMGGIQSLARATFSKLLPQDTTDHTSYFSFYDVTFHISVVVGTFSYGIIEQVTGSMRNSTIALASFFIIGFIVLMFVKMRKETK